MQLKTTSEEGDDATHLSLVFACAITNIRGTVEQDRVWGKPMSSVLDISYLSSLWGIQAKWPLIS